MITTKILRVGIFILAFLVGLLREGVAQGQNELIPAYKASPGPASGEIHLR